MKCKYCFKEASRFSLPGEHRGTGGGLPADSVQPAGSSLPLSVEPHLRTVSPSKDGRCSVVGLRSASKCFPEVKSHR
ncbi:hypothetical protein ANANG_G00267750 [Anguilla anguilla]|uniref:Uncharacterized protein n=1 Tax=Anguilla anguilla TaxID=7936 RepID=A0A9D3LYI5_ANGAN|nr:hypothetical protein ANANG_G00267750 [Anguilla anguilla]